MIAALLHNNEEIMTEWRALSRALSRAPSARLRAVAAHASSPHEGPCRPRRALHSAVSQCHHADDKT